MLKSKSTHQHKTRTTDGNITIQFGCRAKHLPSVSFIEKCVKVASLTKVEATIRFVTQKESAFLNGYRQKNTPTNVLSFCYQSESFILGDIAICAAVARKEAIRYDKDLTAHYAHLIIHGILHLQGFDHQNEEDSFEMAEQESIALNLIGFQREPLEL